MKNLYQSVLLVTIFFYTVNTFAQTPIVTVNVTTIPAAGTAGYIASGALGSSLSSKTYNYTFGAATQTSYNLKDLNNFTIGPDTYNYSYTANSYVKIRRADNAVVSGNRSLLWLESLPGADSTKIAIINPYKENMENVFDDNTFNAGTDNIFGNQGDGNGNNNNIERLDVIFPYGVTSVQKNKSGFAVFERGADNAHDPFVIAPITAIDASGNPTAYGDIVRVAGNTYGNIPSSATNYYIVRRDTATEANLRVSSWGNQNIGGVFISFNDLGVNNNVKIYGYSLFPVDLPLGAISANLVNYSDTLFFPRNTPAITSSGGLDLMAITGVFATANSIVVPPTAYDVSNAPVVQTETIAPFVATAVNTTIASYTIQTLPPVSAGFLSVYINGVLTPAVAGQLLTPSQISTMVFTPDGSFSGNAQFTYSATDNNSLSSNIATYTIPVIANQTTLAVHVTHFTATLNKAIVQLTWQTNNEINNSYFEIQRSTDGKTYQTVATETATNKATINNYDAADDLFFNAFKTVYYRIKSVATNGSYTFSAVIIINTGEALPEAVRVWPVPFASRFTVQFNSDTNGTVQVKISSMDGAAVMQTSRALVKGNNNITINQLASTPVGTYLLTLSNSTKTQTVKVIKN